MGGLFGGGSTISSTEPRIGALRVQTSSYGSVIPLVYGRQRISGNLIWFGDFTPIPHTATQTTGGKGGGVTQSNTTYTYQTGLILGLCEGEILGIGAVWKGKTKHASLVSAGGMSEFLGADGQAVWSYLTSNHAPEAVPYSGLAYVAHGSYDLGSNSSLDNHSFEISGKFQLSASVFDCDPAVLLLDFLTHPTHGAGFPAANIANLADFSDYCIAAGLLVSPAYTEQKPAQEHLLALVQAVNCEFVFSGGLLKIIPRDDAVITGNGVTYTPNIAVRYHLTDDAFLEGSELVCRRSASADAFNSVSLEFVDRDNDYNVAIAEAKDQANIEAFGLRAEDTQKMHFICDAAVAQKVAQARLQRILYIRNSYDFQLGWNYARLEPMDVVTLTDPALGLDRYPVRIESIEEDADGALRVIANEFLAGISNPALYASQISAGWSSGQNALPGNINAPLLFEPPLSLTNGGNEVWAAVSGGSEWGGCGVWVSLDNATYERVGEIQGSARYGTLNAALPAPAATPDIANVLDVQLNAEGQILPASQAAVDAGVSLCYVGGEIMAYRDASLLALLQYQLSYLRRGLEGTSAVDHLAGAQFARLDQALMHHAYQASLVGKNLFFKFTSFNKFRQQEQSLADVTAYNRTLTGGIPSGPANFSLQQPFVGLFAKLQWSAVVGATSYDVEVWSAGILRDAYATTSTTFTYALSNALLDGGPWRDYAMRVRSVSNNLKSGWAQINISNPTPAVPANIIMGTVTANSIALSWDAIIDVDMQDYQVWVSTTSGFIPDATTLAATVTSTSATLAGLTAGTTYYIKLAARDQWGAATLNYSAEITQATL